MFQKSYFFHYFCWYLGYFVGIITFLLVILLYVILLLVAWHYKRLKQATGKTPTTKKSMCASEQSERARGKFRIYTLKKLIFLNSFVYISDMFDFR